MARQLNLFEPSLNVTPRLKAAMREAIKNCRLSREEIIDRMRARASVDGLGGGRGSTISLPNLDAWCSESKPNLIPANLLTTFCLVVGDLGPLKVLAAPLGCMLIDGREMQLLKWAKIEVQAKQLSKKRRKILSEIEGMQDEDTP